MTTSHGRFRVILLGALLIAFAMTACDNCPYDDTIEPAQQAFLDSMEINNGLSRDDLYISTHVNNCPTSQIYVFDTHGKLVRLPRNINALKSLRNFSIVSAGLTSLPEELLEMDHINSILLDGNSICNITTAMDSFLSERSLYWKVNQKCP